MSKPTTPNNPAQQEPTAEASVLRAVSALAAAVEKVPQDKLDQWAKSTLKDYLALVTALAKLVEQLSPRGGDAARPTKTITPEALRQLTQRLGLLPREPDSRES
jgi:hypothetical protein